MEETTRLKTVDGYIYRIVDPVHSNAFLSLGGARLDEWLAIHPLAIIGWEAPPFWPSLSMPINRRNLEAYQNDDNMQHLQ